MAQHIFGIRHHGPGSARSLREALNALAPDLILVEGPPDAADVVSLMLHEQMKPPVALLIYVPEQPRRAVYYPFAVFSPEWQALHYGLTHSVPVRFMDLPQAHQLALPDGEPAKDESIKDDAPLESSEPASELQSEIRVDPLRWLAEAAGYSDGERWWEHMVEHRQDSRDLFRAILEAMTALREAVPPVEELRESQREAYMRQTVRAAEREGFDRVAIVCGAWHAPAIASQVAAKEDTALLKKLPKIKVQATWVPWTYGRLAMASGYGAGIESPGWYHHLWSSTDRTATRWMARVAALLREQDLDASPASVIEAVRLSETLAAMRDRPLPGLPELNEAIQTVLCFGSDLPMRLIHEKLIVGERLGHVPEETPTVPLMQDLMREQKRLRLNPEAIERALDLDLRKPNDLDRSRLLHRLNLLGIQWGKQQRVAGKSGTFHEMWRLLWQPELAVSVIEAGVWGNRISDAATNYARDKATKATELPALTVLVNNALLADLPEAIAFLMERLQSLSAMASDVAHLMDALPTLVNVLRYGNVRRTDASQVEPVVDGLVARISIGLPGACASLNDEAALMMFNRLLEVNSAIALLENQGHRAQWSDTLKQMTDQRGLHGLLAGRCTRLLLDSGSLITEDAARRMNLALSTANEPAQAAAWVEGFLKNSGLVLLHDETLWQVLDEWVMRLKSKTFTTLLPLLRRTFTTFSAPERRQMGERAQHGAARAVAQSAADFDLARAEAALPLVARLLGFVIKGDRE